MSHVVFKLWGFASELRQLRLIGDALHVHLRGERAVALKHLRRELPFMLADQFNEELFLMAVNVVQARDEYRANLHSGLGRKGQPSRYFVIEFQDRHFIFVRVFGLHGHQYSIDAHIDELVGGLSKQGGLLQYAVDQIGAHDGGEPFF